MKKIIIALVMLCLLTGCGSKQEQQTQNKNQDSVQEEVKNEETTKEPLYISAIYVTQIENETLKDDFYVFREDGTFYRQNNSCACYYIHEGTYEIVKKDDKQIINLRPDGDIERHLEYNVDRITFLEETDDTDTKQHEFKNGCGFFMNDFVKTEESNVTYQDAKCDEGIFN